MPYTHDQEIPCKRLYAKSAARNKWQRLAYLLETELLERMVPPLALRPNWTGPEMNTILAMHNIPKMVLLTVSNKIQEDADKFAEYAFLEDCVRSLNCRVCPIGTVGYSAYSDRCAYFWQEVYNIIGYLWTLAEGDAA